MSQRGNEERRIQGGGDGTVTVASDTLRSCYECGMLMRPREFHPYTACVLFKLLGNGEHVRVHLRVVAQYGYEAALAGEALPTALGDIAYNRPPESAVANESPTPEEPA